jgi:hypothetical protein
MNRLPLLRFFCFLCIFICPLQVWSRSTILYCSPTYCDSTSYRYLQGLVRDVTRDSRRQYLLSDSCKDPKSITLEKKDSFAGFLNITLEFAKTRRELCSFEEDLLTDILVLRPQLPYYSSIDLLSALLLSPHIIHDPAHHSNPRFNFHWLDFGSNDEISLNITEKAMFYKFENNVKSFSVTKFSHSSSPIPVPQKKTENESVPQPPGTPVPIHLPYENVYLSQGAYQVALSRASHLENHNCQNSQKKNQLLGVNINSANYQEVLNILSTLYPSLRPGAVIYFQKLFPLKESTDPRKRHALNYRPTALRALHDFAIANQITLQFLPVASGNHEAGAIKVVRSRLRFREI